MTAEPGPTQQSSSPTPSHELAAHAVDALAERKAQDITVLDLREVSGAVADFFVIASGGSDRQIRALANSVSEHIREACSEKPWHEEGREHLQWVLLDYVDLVVHIFTAERREYYDLERLWGDADRANVSEEESAEDLELLRALDTSKANASRER